MKTLRYENEGELAKEGWVRQPDGSYSRPRRGSLGAVEANRAEPTPQIQRRENPRRQQKRVSRGVVARVTLIATRHRLIDPDGVAIACKHVTDLIAAALGVDDADPCVEWSWKQLKCEGEEGVIVKIEYIPTPEQPTWASAFGGDP